jgi:hypothetical protein
MNITTIPKSWGIRRMPPEDFGEITGKYTKSFKETFDYYTFSIQCIRLNKNTVQLICPILRNLLSEITFIQSNGRSLKFNIVRNQKRVTILNVHTTKNIIHLKYNQKTLPIIVENKSRLYEGQDVLVTMQKNEPLPKIIDWIKYYNNIHDIKNICIYDNNSTIYDTCHLNNHLKQIFPKCNIVIEKLNIPYGPETTKWNCNYTQGSMFAAFKQKYGWCSRSVINQDIDELLVIENMTYAQLVTWAKSKSYQGIKLRHFLMELPHSDKYLEFRTLLDCNGRDINIRPKWIWLNNENKDNNFLLTHMITSCNMYKGDVYFAHFQTSMTKTNNTKNIFKTAYKSDINKLRLNLKRAYNINEIPH